MLPPAAFVDCAAFLDTGIRSPVFGVMTEVYGCAAMFAVWAALCGAVFLLQLKK